MEKEIWFYDKRNNSNINDLDSYNVTWKGALERALRPFNVQSTHDCSIQNKQCYLFINL